MAEPILFFMTAYGVAGALFAVPFVTLWAARLAPGARGAPWTFRWVLLPGAVLLWPYLAIRLMRTSGASK